MTQDPSSNTPTSSAPEDAPEPKQANGTANPPPAEAVPSDKKSAETPIAVEDQLEKKAPDAPVSLADQPDHLLEDRTDYLLMDHSTAPSTPETQEVVEEGTQVDHTPVTSIPEAKEVTKARARDLRTLVSKYINRHLPQKDTTPRPTPEPPRIVGAHARLLPILRIIPWFLGLIFAFSFVWDFPGVTTTIFGYTLVVEGLLRILAVSGLIGFFTNWLAITMLFNPRKRRPIFGQGLIPAQRERVIFRLAKAVSEELINEEIIKQKIEENNIIPKYRELALSVTRGVLEDPEFRTELKTLTADYVETVLTSDEVRQKLAEFTIDKIEEYLGEGLGGIALKAYRFLNEEDFKRRIDEAIRGLPSSLDTVLDSMDHLLDTIPEKIEARSEEIEQWATRVVLGFVENLDVYNMIMSNMVKYDEKQLEDLLKKTTNEQLNYIKYLGGVLGCLGGLVIWTPLLSLSVFGLIGLTLYLLDEALYRSGKKHAPPSVQ